MRGLDLTVAPMKTGKQKFSNADIALMIPVYPAASRDGETPH